MSSKRTVSKSKLWAPYLHSQLQDPEEAAEYLGYCFQQGAESFLLALHHLITAWGGVGKLAKESGLNRESLYKLFRGDRGARLSTVITVMETIGIDAQFSHRTSNPRRRKKIVRSKAA